MAEQVFVHDPSVVGECSLQIYKEKRAGETMESEEEDELAINEVNFAVEYFDSSEKSLSISKQSEVDTGESSFSVAEEIEGHRRGSTLVMADGYLYRRNYRNIKNDKNYLLCNQRYDQPFCYARAILQKGLVKVTKPHNHLPDPLKIQQLKMKSRCKQRAEVEATSLKEIVEEEQGNGSFDVHPNFYGTLAKRRKSTMPKIPMTFDQFIQVLQENEDRYCNPDNSSLFFSGFISADDFSVATFISPSFSSILEDVHTIYVDRMFSAVPTIFNHLCTIFITVNNHIFPLVYSLMTNDCEASYTILFTFVKQQIANLKFKLAVLDYDQPIHDALKSAYPLAETCGGFFHYLLAVWREVQLKGLTSEYTENRDVQLCIKMLLSLPVLPPEYTECGIALVQEKILELNSQSAALQDILEFVQECWFNRLGSNSFSVFNEPQRSSTDVDAYLTKLKNKIGNSSRNIWQFIDRLKNFQESERKDFEKNIKSSPKKKSSCLAMNSKIRESIEKLKHNKMNLSDVLATIAIQLYPPTNCSMEMYMDLHQTRVVPLFTPTFQVVAMSQV